MRRRVGGLLAAIDRVAAAALGAPPPAQGSPARALALLGALGAGTVAGAAGLVGVAVLVAAGAGRRRARRRRAEANLVVELNDIVPLLQLAVGAGLTVRGTLVAIAPWSTGGLGAHLARIVERVAEGASLAEELDRMPDQLGEGCRGLVAVLNGAERYGSPLAEPLGRLGGELRLQRRRQLEQAARRVPVRLLFPLAAGVLPAFVLLAVAPLVATSLEGIVVPAP